MNTISAAHGLLILLYDILVLYLKHRGKGDIVAFTYTHEELTEMPVEKLAEIVGELRREFMA